MPTLNGRCHCGSIEVELRTESDAALSPRHCGCDFCHRHGALYVSTSSGTLLVTLNSRDVSRYEFGHRTAKFLVCSRCGVMVTAISEIDARTYAVLNANVLSPPLEVDRSAVPTADYEAEDISIRLDRRKKRWIANVTLIER